MITRAKQIVCAVLEDLSERDGFKQVFKDMGVETQSELFKEIVQVVDDMLAKTVSDKVAEDLMLRFQNRKKEWEGKQKDNGLLPAGSPMYYYCKACGILIEMRSEGRFVRVPPLKHCQECVFLMNKGLIN